MALVLDDPAAVRARQRTAAAGGRAVRLPAPGGWPALRAAVLAQQAELTAPRPGAAGLCAVCHGPAAAGCARCFQCDLHLQCAGGSLADVVVPVAFAVKSGPHARRLWQYKSARAAPEAAAEASASLLALLLVFLRGHAGCVWRAGGIAGRPHVAVVPTARGRPGEHPLRALAAPYLAGPWAGLSARPGGQRTRDLDPGRFLADPVPGAAVLLLDDTWTTGASVQSAAMALRRAGARSVAAVVLGRHVAGPWPAGVAGAAVAPLCADACAVHDRPQDAAARDSAR